MSNQLMPPSSRGDTRDEEEEELPRATRASRRHRVQSPSPPHVFFSSKPSYAEVVAAAMEQQRSTVSPDQMVQYVKNEVREVQYRFQQLLLVFLVFLLLLALGGGAFFLRDRSSSL